MKNRLALFMLCLLTAAAVFSCGNNAETATLTEENAETVEETEGTEEADIEADNTAKTEDSAPTYAITSVEAEGYEYFEGSVECIQITDDKHELLAEAIDEFFAGRVSMFNEDIESLNDEAQQFNEENKEYAEENDYEYSPIKYQDDSTVTVVRADNQVLSFIIIRYQYMGGAHGSAIYGGYTFDSNTGEMLSFEDFGDLTTLSDAAKAFILDTIASSPKEAQDVLFNDDVISYTSTIEDYFSNGNTPEFYLDNRGVTFIFQQYDIAPYAAGVIAFTVPYQVLDGFSEKYIPKDTFYTVELSLNGFAEYFDLNNDGNLQKVYIINEGTEEVNENTGDNDIEYTLFVGDSSVSSSIGEADFFAQATYIHTTEGNFVLVSCEGASVTLYEISDGIKKLGTIDTDLSVKEITEDQIILAERTYDDTGSSWEVKWGEPEAHRYSKTSFK